MGALRKALASFDLKEIWVGGGVMGVGRGDREGVKYTGPARYLGLVSEGIYKGSIRALGFRIWFGYWL